MPTSLDDLRRFTVARSFPKPVTLKRALHRMHFVQADPIRAPARAQDLILRQRVNNYHAGDLERDYASLDIEEDMFVNYGYVTKELFALMHPRSEEGEGGKRGTGKKGRTELLLEFVRKHGEVHPRDVDEHFSHGKVTNYWGGSSNATTHLMDAMHYQGLLRVVRREKGIRIYTARQQEYSPTDLAERRARIDSMVDVVVHIYGPLTGSGLSTYVRRLRYAAPQWTQELASALQRAKDRLAHACVDGIDWYWPAGEKLVAAVQDTIRLLAPFDPVVHDRARFEILWGWPYRFEAYTPRSKRKLGYYAMPLLWRDRVIGWGNLSVKNGELVSEFGYLSGAQPRDRAFKQGLNAELDSIRAFLGLES